MFGQGIWFSSVLPSCLIVYEVVHTTDDWRYIPNHWDERAASRMDSERWGQTARAVAKCYTARTSGGQVIEWKRDRKREKTRKDREKGSVLVWQNEKKIKKVKKKTEKMVIGLLFSPIALLLCGPSGGLTISHSSTNRAHPFATSVQLSHSSKFHHLHNIIHRIHRQTHIVVSSLSFFFSYFNASHKSKMLFLT